MLMTDVVATLKSWITCCHCTIVLQRWPIAALQCCRVEWTYLWLLDTERHVFLFQLYGEQDGLKSVLDVKSSRIGNVQFVDEKLTKLTMWVLFLNT